MLIKRLSQIYSPNIITISTQTSVAEAMRTMQQKKISCILVEDEKRPVGIITERSIVRFAAKASTDFNQWKLIDIMGSPVFTAPPDTDIFSAYNQLTSKKIRHLVVVDNEGMSLGVVTLTDIIEYLGHDYFVELKTVDQIMSKILSTISKDASVYEALIQLADISASCLIVAEGRRPVGIVTERDMTRLLFDGHDLHKLKVEKVMSTPVYTTLRHIPVLDAARIMKENSVRRVVVVDQNDSIVGLITQTDIVKELESSYIKNLKKLIEEKTLHLEKALMTLEARTIYLDNILRSSINLGIAATDLNFTVTYFNPAAEHILGCRARDVIGHNAGEIHKHIGRSTDVF
jgi:CBS domain-containing protein